MSAKCWKDARGEAALVIERLGAAEDHCGLILRYEHQHAQLGVSLFLCWNKLTKLSTSRWLKLPSRQTMRGRF